MYMYNYMLTACTCTCICIYLIIAKMALTRPRLLEVMIILLSKLISYCNERQRTYSNRAEYWYIIEIQVDALLGKEMHDDVVM